MPFKELVKDVQPMRAFVRELYVHGFRSRGEVGSSARSYDDQRRRVESWLEKDTLRTRRTASGKTVFLSFNGRAYAHNPLYRLWKTAAFTEKECRLFFYTLNTLQPGVKLPFQQLLERVQACGERLDGADFSPDESLLRKKLGEYVSLGLFGKEKQGRESVYFRLEEAVQPEEWRDILDFFSETDSSGFVGSTLLDRLPPGESPFAFRHHDLLTALDTQVFLQLAEAIGDRQRVTLCLQGREGGEQRRQVLPLRFYCSVQNGRRYCAVWEEWRKDFLYIRLDRILRVTPGEEEPRFSVLLERLLLSRRYIWGVAAGVGSRAPCLLEMVIRVGEKEEYVSHRLSREGRGGEVTSLGGGLWRYRKLLFNPEEALPWVRTFIGRIVSLSCGDAGVTRAFLEDLRDCAGLYTGERHV